MRKIRATASMSGDRLIDGDTLAACRKLLRSDARDHGLVLQDMECAGWLCGRAGDDCALPRDPQLRLHTRQAWLLGAGQHASALQQLDQNLASAEGKLLLMHACVLAGHALAKQLLDLARRFPERWFSGPHLACVDDPEVLLALFPAERIDTHAIATIGELLLRACDDGRETGVLERRWQAIVERPAPPEYSADFRNVVLRLAARTDLEQAIYWLETYDMVYPRDEHYSGMLAVLGRLIGVDPEQATRLVAARPEAQQQVAWLPGLCWWYSLPQPVEHLLQDIQDSDREILAVQLARALLPARGNRWRECLGPNLSAGDAVAAARQLGPALRQLHAGGFTQDADDGRAELSCWLDAQRGFGTALLRVRSHPLLPALTPWSYGPTPP